jgi:hypothetical protein
VGSPAAPTGPLTAAERYIFDLYGYVVRRGALGADEVAGLNAGIDALHLPPPGTDIMSQRYSGHLTTAQCFRDLLDHPAVWEPILEMCGDHVRLDHAYGIYMAPGTSGLGLHGGGTPHDPAQYYEVRAGRMYNGLVAVQWALVDHRPGEGGFGCIPGSHRAEFPRPADTPADWVVEVPMQAGDVVIFTEALTHCTLPWRGKRERRTLLNKYAPGHLSWGRDYQGDLAALAGSGLLTPRQRVLMDPPSVYPRTSLRSFGP